MCDVRSAPHPHPLTRAALKLDQSSQPTHRGATKTPKLKAQAVPHIAQRHPLKGARQALGRPAGRSRSRMRVQTVAQHGRCLLVGGEALQALGGKLVYQSNAYGKVALDIFGRCAATLYVHAPKNLKSSSM